MYLNDIGDYNNIPYEQKLSTHKKPINRYGRHMNFL